MAGQFRSVRSPLKLVEFLLLAVLDEEPLHGYGLVQEIEVRTEGRVKLRPADVYRIIYRLQQWGLLGKVERRPADRGSNSRRRTYYAITEAGREVAAAEARMLASVSSPLVSKTVDDGGRR